MSFTGCRRRDHRYRGLDHLRQRLHVTPVWHGLDDSGGVSACRWRRQSRPVLIRWLHGFVLPKQVSPNHGMTLKLLFL